MSYCRFGEDSDVFVYPSRAYGEKIFTIQIAENRWNYDIEQPEDIFAISEEELEKFIIPLNYGFEGKSISFSLIENTLYKLKELSDIGYRVPDCAFERLSKELGIENFKRD